MLCRELMILHNVLIDALTRHLAVEWGHQNIRLNVLAPGMTEGTVGLNKLGKLNNKINLKKVHATPIPLVVYKKLTMCIHKCECVLHSVHYSSLLYALYF